MAEEIAEVDQIKRREPGTPYASGFAFVVANPPYGAKLSDEYKDALRSEWADVFHGQPDTYVFFFKLGVELLATNGRLGFITPNTYLMGTHTAALRGMLLSSGRIEQIVDLPQGIWTDANVDCVLLFLAAESDEALRRAQQVQVNLLNLRDKIDKLTERQWNETLIQQQSRWMDDPQDRMDIRYNKLLQQIENACLISVGNGKPTVQTLGTLTESSAGIDPYETEADGRMNVYIRPHRDISSADQEWKPLLDSTAFVGRYELRWGSKQPYIKYGDWLCRPREKKFFESPKLLIQDVQNRAIRRRLVATLDERRFYNRKNFNNVVMADKSYNIKYVLGLFNSSLLNYWFTRRIDNVHVNPAYFRQLPIYPADTDTQMFLVTLVDEMLANNAELNRLRAEGYAISTRDNTSRIAVPYDRLLADLQRSNSGFAAMSFFDARAIGLFSIPERCDMDAQVSGNVFTPDRHPQSVVLRNNKLWLDVPDDAMRRYLRGYLGQPQWRGKTWDDLRNRAFMPADTAALATFFAAEAEQITRIQSLLDDVARIDAEIDTKVLDLYGIHDTADRQRILGSAPSDEEESTSSDEEAHFEGVTEE